MRIRNRHVMFLVLVSRNRGSATTNLLSDLNLGLFHMKKEPEVDPIKQGTVFSRFKAKEWSASPSTSSNFFIFLL